MCIHRLLIIHDFLAFHELINATNKDLHIVRFDYKLREAIPDVYKSVASQNCQNDF